MNTFKLKSLFFTLVLSIQFLLVPSLNAQSLNRILDKPGGGSGSGSVSNDDGNSNAGLYILAGVAVAAILVYKFILEKPAKEAPEEKENETKEFSLMEHEKDIAYYKEKLPVDLFIGFQQKRQNLPDQSIVMGVSVKF